MRLTIGIDFGGSSSKVTVLNERGEVVATAKREYPSISAHSGWLEQDVDELSVAMVENIKAALSHPSVNASDIVAVAIDAATHMPIFCDENDRPLRPMIHWSDSRSYKEVAYLKEHHLEVIERHSANAVGSAWTLPQILWVIHNEPWVLEKTKRLYFGKDYFRHLLTGDYVTDYIEIMGTMLADDVTCEWEPELLSLVGLSVDQLPKIVNPGDIAGYVLPEMAALTGLVAGTPVIVGSTDTVMEVFSTGAIAEGQATIKLATAGRICPITSDRVDHPQFYNYKHIVPGLWYPGTATRSCAASYTWMRNTFGDYEALIAAEKGTSAYELMNAQAEQVPPGSEGVIFHPYLLGEMSPYADDLICADFLGVRMNHGKGHFIRAVMEGVSYSMRDCLQVIEGQGIELTSLFAIGGGIKGALWRQILADVLQRPLTCVKEADSSLGSAMLAGISAGMFASFEDCVKTCQRTTIYVEPNPANREVYDKGFAAYKAYQAALAPIYHSV